MENPASRVSFIHKGRVMLSVRDRDMRKAGLASGAIHLAVLSIAVILLFRQSPVDTANQFVFLISDSKPNSAAKAHSQKVNQVITKADNHPVMQPAVQVPAVAPVKPVPAQAAAHGAPSTKKEQARATTSGVQGMIEARFGDASGLNFRHYEEPVYPQAARRMNKEGKVRLRLTIDEKGTMTNLEIVHAAAFGFTEATIDAVKRWTFIPARKDGIPVIARASWTVSFKLTD